MHQGEESWVSQGLVGGIWVLNGDWWRRERKGKSRRGKYHGKKREVPEMRTQECQIILFHLKFCLELGVVKSQHRLDNFNVWLWWRLGKYKQREFQKARRNDHINKPKKIRPICTTVGMEKQSDLRDSFFTYIGCLRRAESLCLHLPPALGLRKQEAEEQRLGLAVYHSLCWAHCKKTYSETNPREFMAFIYLFWAVLSASH